MVARGRERGRNRGREGGGGERVRIQVPHPGTSASLTENCGVLAKEICPVPGKIWQKWPRSVGRFDQVCVVSSPPQIKAPPWAGSRGSGWRFLVRRRFSDRRRGQPRGDVSIVLESLQTACSLSMACSLFTPGVDLCYQEVWVGQGLVGLLALDSVVLNGQPGSKGPPASCCSHLACVYQQRCGGIFLSRLFMTQHGRR